MTWGKGSSNFSEVLYHPQLPPSTLLPGPGDRVAQGDSFRQKTRAEFTNSSRAHVWSLLPINHVCQHLLGYLWLVYADSSDFQRRITAPKPIVTEPIPESQTARTRGCRPLLNCSPSFQTTGNKVSQLSLRAHPGKARQGGHASGTCELRRQVP